MMNTREFLNSVIELNASEELTAKAKDLIEKLDNRNVKRADTVKAKRDTENAPLLAKLEDFMKGQSSVLACDIAKALEVSSPKATALAKKLVANGKAEVSEVKLPKKGVVKSYRLKA